MNRLLPPTAITANSSTGRNFQAEARGAEEQMELRISDRPAFDSGTCPRIKFADVKPGASGVHFGALGPHLGGQILKFPMGSVSDDSLI